MQAAPAGTAEADAARSARLEGASTSDLGVGPAPARGHQLTEPVRALLGVAGAVAWGGTYVASTGEPVNLRFSNAYPEDPARAQSWAAFVASLVHGDELRRVRIYLAPLDEVRRICGRGSLACYSGLQETIVSPGEDVPNGPTAESILAHEYGHHVALNRLNAPWRAVDYGTKRWASYARICQRTVERTAFPGDEGARYRLNPGEAFAEAYRVLNERRLARGETSWSVVDASFYPDAAALALLEQDVLQPWTTATTVTLRGSFTRRGARTRSFTVATPLDGALEVRLRAPAAARYRLSIRDANGAVLSTGTGATGARGTVCGQRSVSVRVARATGAGAFSLSVSRP